MVSFSKYGHYSDDDLKYDMNGFINGYHLHDGIYILLMKYGRTCRKNL
ncbi:MULTISPECIES: hypothetical protein [Staphylococcus]|nr:MULTISPECIES: hypothetical protein [Staphylococcus]MDT4010913.1 hypothetical protein [Staphylococcus simulans]